MPLCQQVFWKGKKLVVVLAISISITKQKTEKKN